MFVAIKTGDQSRITSIASQWDGQETTLRELTDSGQLICPGCNQPLWLRVGKTRRRHFAHRSLAECPLERQSSEVLEAKAQLYEWLETKYPGSVNLDMPVGVPGGNKIIDLLVEARSGRKFAYWIFDRQQRSRNDFLAYQQQAGVHVHFIHTESTLKIDPAKDIVLTASQREFIARSEFDAPVDWCGRGHLHFLTGETSKLRIYRGLHCVHQPNLYQWTVVRTHRLADALISPHTGEIVFAEDVAARDDGRRKNMQEDVSGRTARPGFPPAGPEESEPDTTRAVVLDQSPASEQKPDEPPINFNGPFCCEDCGTMTTHWSTATPSAGTCVCKGCVKKRWDKNVSGENLGHQ